MRTLLALLLHASKEMVPGRGKTLAGRWCS